MPDFHSRPPISIPSWEAKNWEVLTRRAQKVGLVLHASEAIQSEQYSLRLISKDPISVHLHPFRTLSEVEAFLAGAEYTDGLWREDIPDTPHTPDPMQVSLMRRELLSALLEEYSLKVSPLLSDTDIQRQATLVNIKNELYRKLPPHDWKDVTTTFQKAFDFSIIEPLLECPK